MIIFLRETGQLQGKGLKTLNQRGIPIALLRLQQAGETTVRPSGGLSLRPKRFRVWSPVAVLDFYRKLTYVRPSLLYPVGCCLSNWLKFRVVALAKLVYNQAGVCTPAKPFLSRAIGQRLKRGVKGLCRIQHDWFVGTASTHWTLHQWAYKTPRALTFTNKYIPLPQFCTLGKGNADGVFHLFPVSRRILLYNDTRN